MKGQMGISFQYIFVMLAGAAFLFFFFFMIKGCTETSEERIDTFSTAASVTKIRSMVYQGDTTANISIVPSLVTCPGGTLTLRSEGASNSLEKTPAFLSPEITGRMTVQTKEVLLGSETESPIPLGSVLYGLDESAYYLVVQDVSGEYRRVTEFLPSTFNVRSINQLTLNDPAKIGLPSNAETAVIVSVGTGVSLDGRTIPDFPQRFLGVTILPQTDNWGVAVFYEREGDKLVEEARKKYYTDYMAAGAAVAGVPENFECGVLSFGDRMKTLTVLYERRALNISVEPGLPGFCVDALSSSTNQLSITNSYISSSLEEYMTDFFNNAPQLMVNQLSLLDSSCPVIA